MRTGLLLAVVATGLLAALASANTLDDMSVSDTREWNFRVLLDDSEIGYHRFQLTELGDRRRLLSEASFDVRFLFVTAYRYRHVNREVWDGRCLDRIETDTDSNGQELSVKGSRASTGFVIDAGDDVRELPDCVMSFAYWDPAFLGQQRLLNPQTGEYVDVNITMIDQCELTVRGERVVANHYRITGQDMKIDVWYSSAREWVALESEAKGGRKIRYELT